MGLLSRRLGNAAAAAAAATATARTTELHQQKQKQQHRPNSAVLGGAIAGGAAAALLLVALMLLILHRRLKKASKTSPSDVAAPRLRRFSYRELKAATGGFGEAHKLGQGGFGSVFKGTLRGGQQVAVKRLDTASLQGEREFVNEVSVMGSMGVSSSSIIGSGGGGGSPHVVGLLGFCADSKRKLLVYEYMENRSLQEALFDESYPVALEWEKRMKIVLDIARALAFLHVKCEPPIIHGDVKPSNVLLDAGFSARLADFGLARVKTEGSVDKDVRSEEVERDSMERERIRSQRVARDRERKRKDKERRRMEAEATAAALEQRGVAAGGSAAMAAGAADENCNKVLSSSSPELTDAAAAPADHGTDHHHKAEDGACAAAAAAEVVSGAADVQNRASEVSLNAAQAQDQNRASAAASAAQEVGACGDSATDENRAAADLAKDSNTDGIAIDVDAEEKQGHAPPHIVVIIPKDEEQDDTSSKSPVSSSLTSPMSKQTNNDDEQLQQQQQQQMMLRSRMNEDDDEWSKMSQCAETEADTWSKVSPSEIDCRSEMSVESGGGGHYGHGIRGGMNFLGRKRSWGRKKAMSPSPSSGGKGSRDWWWKQEGGGGGEFSIKGYIVDWVSSEARRGRSRTREWPWSSSSTATTTTAGATEDSPGSKKKKKKKQARSGSLEWWAECDDHDSDELMKRIRAEQKRKRKQQQQQNRSVSRESSREWWRDGGGVGLSGELCNEEFSGEILNNSSTRREMKKRSMSEESFTFYHSGELGNAAAATTTATTATAASLNNSCELLVTAGAAAGSGRRRVRTHSREWWSGEMQRGKEWWSGELGLGSKKANIPPNVGGRFFDWSRESLSGELVGSNRRRERHRRDRSRSRSRDWWSGDLLSRGTTVSSTPSMRGTVCYVAPEYGGGGMMTEKSDVYSFGVLVLVVVSGRRPLQVVASPLSEFERANLISWARHAAQAGRQLDLVDPSLGGAFSKEQATLCISLALLCLQRLPAVRPTMGEVVKILSGEAELPALPFEFSPSPPGGIGPSFKSRRKASSEQVAVDLPLLA